MITDAVFHVFDTDGSGFIGFPEYVMALESTK